VSYNSLPGFGITTIVEALNSAGQWPDCRQVFASHKNRRLAYPLQTIHLR
jgi:hypothetical protein